MTNIYHFDPKSGEYIGDGVADASPLEPGVWLIPAYATSDAPPQIEAGHRPVWTGEAWEQRIDLRGTPIWLADGSATVVSFLGPLPAGATTEPPASASPEQREAQRQAILAATDWTQLADTLLDNPTLKAAWATYRSAVRRMDITTDSWPEAPAQETTQ